MTTSITSQPYLNMVNRITFPCENIIILVLLVLTTSLNFVQYSCTEFKVICKSRSFSANTTVSSTYNKTNNFQLMGNMTLIHILLCNYIMRKIIYK